MTHHYKTKKTLKTKKLTQFLKEFNLPLSPSLGSMISSLGEDNYENWEEAGAVWTHDRANAQYKRIVNEYEPPQLDPAIDEELQAFVARRTEAGGAPTDY